MCHSLEVERCLCIVTQQCFVDSLDLIFIHRLGLSTFIGGGCVREGLSIWSLYSFYSTTTAETAEPGVALVVPVEMQ